jgi:ABC-2 type transport system ATP-binding protein
MTALALKNITYRYPHAATPSVNAVDLNVEEGEFLGLLGPNGAGKTTLLSIIVGLMSPQQGSMEILSQKYRLQLAKQLINVVPQEIALFETLTAYENLEFFGSLRRLPKPELQQAIRSSLQAMGLEGSEHKLLKHFSGGMMRRLNIAVALLTKSKILILDEPTVGVDPQSRQLVFETLKKLNNEGVTIIYSTHYMEEAEKICSQIVVIDAGRIVLKDKTSNLLRAGEQNLEQKFLQLTGHSLRD